MTSWTPGGTPDRLVDALAGLSVLVVGEAFLDGWLTGPPQRLSREAPVPVVTLADTVLMPGAAGNTAVNAAALGANVRLLTVVGDDEDGVVLRAALVAAGVNAEDVLVARGRRTVAKRRVLAGGQMVVRLDEGDSGPLPPDVARQLRDRAEVLVGGADVVIAGDYDAGVFGGPVPPSTAPSLAAGLMDTVAAASRLVVDARHPRRWARAGAAAAKPNAVEAAELLGAAGAPLLDPDQDRAAIVAAHADALLDASGARVLAVTLDVDGGVVLERGRAPVRLPAAPVAASRAAGAGDAFTAAFALALAAGAPAVTAGTLGAAAARCGLTEARTCVTSADVLRTALAPRDGLPDAGRLAALVRGHRAAGRRIVLTNGCFDDLHRGHVRYLRRARELGDVLVVGVNSDASATRLRGRPPGHALADRVAVLAALSCVDQVAVFDGDTARELVELVRPDVYVKGGDHTPESVPEASVVVAQGGEVRILPYEDETTSEAWP